jgi:diguanylate cyclase (GGDEF)-like protein/PAS domain S-box-containing protein
MSGSIVERAGPSDDTGGARERGWSRFEAAFLNAPIGMSVVSAAGRCLEANAALCRLLAYSESELIGLDLFDLVHPDDLRAARDSWRRLVQGGSESVRAEYRYVRRDARQVWVAITSTMLRDAAGSPLYAVSQTEDITPRREAEEARRTFERRYGDLIERSNDLIFTLDLNGVITSVNPAAESITGHTPDELVGRRLIDVVVEEESEKAGRMLDRLLGGQDVTAELEMHTPDGRVVFIEASSRLVRDGDTPTGIEGIARDVTERHALQEELARQAFYDALTGLPNRALFIDRMSQGIARLKRPGEAVAVMVLGLDDFKSINRDLGHSGGDDLLKALAPLLEDKLRGSDTVARLGSDQFGLIIENLASEDHAHAVAGRILATVTEFDTRRGRLSGSLGIAIAEPGSNADALLENAHTAMHKAKRENRGSFEVYGAEIQLLRSE